MVADDRGQIVLVGAVVIAFIIIGIVVVFNGVVFTESVGDQGTVTDTRSGGSIGLAAEETIGETAHTVNTEEKYTNMPDSELEESLDDASPYLSAAEAESGGNFVNVSFEGNPQAGHRVYQNETGNFTSDDDTITEQGDWVFTDQETTIDRFVVVVDPGASGGSVDLVTVSGLDLTDPLNPTITPNENLQIDASDPDQVTLSGAVSGDCSDINATDGGNGVVTLQISRGFVLERPDCEITFPGNETGTNGMGFTGGGDVEGTYDVVMADQPSSTVRTNYLDEGGAEDSDQPNLSEIVWSAEYRIVYDAGQVEKVVEKEVDHYG